MKRLFLFIALLMFSLTLHSVAHAQAGPQEMAISCAVPKPSGQHNLKRPRGDSNTWVFRINPVPSVHWVEGPNWNYPGKNGGDPDWGQWSGGDGQLWLGWIAPDKLGSFNIKVTGKITCGNGGDGGPIDIEADWFGEVVAKNWKADPDIEGGKMLKPQNQTASPADPSVVLVKHGSTVDCEVQVATDKDTWTKGDDSGEEDDTVNYKWTASGGGFVTAEHPNGDATEATTRAAQWKAPTDPGEYSLQCVIDDEGKVEDPETGTRDDEAVTRTVNVKVVDVRFSPTVVYMYVGDTKDVTATITPEDVTSLLTFTMLDAGTASLSGQAPEFTVTGLAAGSTKLQAKYHGEVLGELSVVVKDPQDDDLDGDGIPNDQDDDIDDDGIPDVATGRIWSPGSGISGGEFSISEVHAAPGGTIGLEVTQAGDSDHWRQGNDTGDEPDSVHYDWSSNGGGSVVQDSTEPWKSTFTAPTEAGEYYVKVRIDDAPATVSSPDVGNRNDSAVTRTIKVIVTQKKWDTDLAIGKDRLEDGTVVDNGRMISPQDQRQEPYQPDKVSVAAGTSLSLEVEAATDIDHWKHEPDSNGTEGYDNYNVTYTWSATGGTVTPDPNDPKKATWQADDEGDYTIKCTIEDEPKAIASDESGSRDDDAVVREVKVKVAPFDIEWEGLARACAGGIGVDGVHDFTITGTAKREDGSIVPNAELKLSFEGNKGHDYSSDPAGIKPDGWTTDDIKKAKFVTTDGQGHTTLVEEMTLTTDAEGKISVHVLGSDIISNDIKIKVKWKDSNDEEHDVGGKECDFGEAVSYRRFPNQYDPNEVEDTGWLFNQKWLTKGNQTTGKVYMKFMRDLAGGDVQGNWDEVNGHRMKFDIAYLDMQDHSRISSNFDDYARIIPNLPNGMTITSTSVDGAATTMIEGEDEVDQVQTVWLKAKDLTQWNN